MIEHVMVDLETWGTAPYSTIIAIGACVFDPYAEEIADILLNRFEVGIAPVNAGLRVDADTLMWWMNPERNFARETWLSMSKVPLLVALDGFTEWLGENKDFRIWGNGAGFDNVLLRQAYEINSRDAPWGFRQDRCFRTLKSMAAVEDKQDFGVTLVHTALADAENQAIHANRIVRQLGLKLT